MKINKSAFSPPESGHKFGTILRKTVIIIFHRINCCVLSQRCSALKRVKKYNIYVVSQILPLQFKLLTNVNICYIFIYVLYIYPLLDSTWRSWLRQRAKSRKVASSFPDDDTGTFIDLILSVAIWRWS